MAKQTINIGSVPNDGTGSTLREGGDLINDNFNEIYTAIGDGTTLTSGTFLTTTNSETVQNKTISGLNNTLSNIANASLTNSTLSIVGDDSSAQSISLGGSILFTGGSGITTSISGNEITFATDGSIVTETSSAVLTNKTINAPDNTITNITNTNLSGSAGITNANLANSTVSIVADDSSAQSISLGGSILFTGGSGVTTAISGNEITFSKDGSVVTESSSDVLTNKTINGPDNTLTNIANGSLANSTITLGSDTLNLGDTTTTITCLSLDVTGTIYLTGAGSKARFNFAGFGSLPTAATYEGMFAYDTVGQVPYVADSGGWTRLQTENDSISVHSDVNITGIADEEILIWSSAQARFNAIPQKINGAAEIDVTNNGSIAYLFDSHYSGNNPDIYVRAGATYAFKLNVSGHPFHLQTVSGAYSSGNAYTTGLTHIAPDGTVTTGASALLKETGTLYYEIPSGTATTIYYACQYHSGMAGSIVVQDDTSVGGVSDIVDDTTSQLGGQLDVNGNAIGDGTLELLKFSETASAVNEFTITNNATGNNPILSATGDDTNIGIDITTKGTGVIKFNDLAYYPEASITSTSNAVAWDSQAEPNAKHTTTENTTFSAPSNATTGSFISLNIQYGGAHTIAFNTVFEFAGSTAPTFTSTSGQVDHLVFRYNGTVWQEMGRTLNMSAT